MPVNVIPDMDEPRLKSLGKQLNRNRKTSLIGHEMLKDELDVYTKSLNKEKKSLNGKFQNKGLALKHKLARVRGTQKCLKQKREQSFYVDGGDHPYGVYDGGNLHTYRREIDDIIEKHHPKYRRQKKVDKCLENSRNKGSILGDEDIKTQFDHIMTKSYDDDDLPTYMKRENQLSMTFLASTKGNATNLKWKSPNAPLATTKTKVRNWLKPRETGRVSRLDDLESSSSTPHGKASPRNLMSPRTLMSSADSDTDRLPDLRSLRTSPSRTPAKLALPPITARKQMVQPDAMSQKTSISLPNLVVRRATKAHVTISNVDVKKLDRLKNRRMTTIA